MKLTIVIDVPDTIDPKLVDPHDVAEAVLDFDYFFERDHNRPTFISAEWGDA